MKQMGHCADCVSFKDAENSAVSLQRFIILHAERAQRL